MSISGKLYLSIVSLIILLIISIFLIPEYISPFGNDEISFELLYNYRIPKSLTAVLCGVSLAISGFILQQIFRNNLAGPYILGVSSGSSLAVALCLLGSAYFPMLSQGLSIPVAGFTGSMAVLLLVLSVSGRFGNGSVILLFGVILGQVSGALQSLLNYMAVPGDLKHFMLWTMGSYSRVIGTDLTILAVTSIAGLIWAFTLMPGLAISILGDDVASTLGVNTRKLTFKLLICTGLLSGICTAYCGPIAFIGMAIPNATRLLFRTADFKKLLLINALLGAMMALCSDIISSVQISQIHIPVNVSTALIGGPFIIYILLKRRH